MVIRPGDLGSVWHIALVRYRALGHARFSPPAEIGRLGRIWASGLGLSEEVAASTLPMMVDTAMPLVAGGGTAISLAALAVAFLSGFRPDVTSGCLLGAAIGLFLCLVVLPRRNFRRLHLAPVRWDELEALKGAQPTRTKEEASVPARKRSALLRVSEGLRGAAPRLPGDDLEREFLRLLQDVTDLRGFDSTTEAAVRSVVNALGEAVGSLPDPMHQNDVPSTATDAVSENDRRLARRLQVLRNDLMAELAAVRGLLPALTGEATGTTGTTGTERLAAVSTTARQVTSEAKAVLAARQDLAPELYPRLAAVYGHRAEPETERTARIEPR
ncbi:MAG: hypothetical protein SFU56_16690 [Capsulimonadales bacterium]|nr:hypothetical protein [Capsulimonadales bacterium]